MVENDVQLIHRILSSDEGCVTDSHMKFRGKATTAVTEGLTGAERRRLHVSGFPTETFGKVLRKGSKLFQAASLILWGRVSEVSVM